MNRLASYHRTRARKCTGVIWGAIGIGIDDVDIKYPRAEDRRRDLLVRGDDSVAHFSRSAGEMVGAVWQ